jgi:NADH dehydrogenase
MRVLVTGGTGVVGTAAVRALVRRGHEVRLYTRNATRDAERWANGVEPWPGDINDVKTLRGAADGCDVVLHIAGIVAEKPPEVTFNKVNVEGTRNVVREAERAGVGRFIYISSLGAERGTSEYHRSKREGEAIVRQFRKAWLILRPGNTYGVGGGDEMSTLLKMNRSLPAMPVIEGGDQPFAPLWADDLGEALALAAERSDLSRTVLDLAGGERTSMNDVLERLARITGRRPARIPLPAWLAETGARVADALGFDVPVSADQLRMLIEGNVLQPGQQNALTAVFGIEPTPLDEGLRAMADGLPEQTPAEGVGRLHRRRYWADIHECSCGAAELLRRFRHGFADIVPEKLVEVGAEPGTPTIPNEGDTLTLSLPVRGIVQVRVLEVSDRVITFMTVEGHPLASAISFTTQDRSRGIVRFEVQTYDRAASRLDAVALKIFGDPMKSATWTTVVERMIEVGGGNAPEGVQHTDEVLEGEDAKIVERWSEALVMAERREEEAQRVSP